MIQYTGLFRLHFNRAEEAPRLASITNMDHTWEIICKSVEVKPGVALVSGADLTSPAMSPKWWLAGNATVLLNSDGHAVIQP